MKVDEQNEPAETIAARLPALPGQLAVLNALLDSRPIDLGRAANLIRSEANLSRRLMQLANSCAITENSSLEEAVVTLGAERLRTVLLIDHLIGITDHALTPHAARAFWYHALVVGALCRWLAVHTGYLRSEMAYQAGVLHDIGRLAVLTDDNEQEARRAGGRHGAPCSCTLETVRVRLHHERVRLGADHARIGGCIAAAWRLPAALCEAIAWHHEPAAAVFDPKLTAMVALADRVPSSRLNPAADGDFVQGVTGAVDRGLQALGIIDPPLAVLLDQQSLQGDLLDLWNW